MGVVVCWGGVARDKWFFSMGSKAERHKEFQKHSRVPRNRHFIIVIEPCSNTVLICF